MSEQMSLFPDLKRDGEPKPLSEEEAKLQTADLLETLLKQGFVNVSQGDASPEHLEKLIHTLRK